MVRSNAINWSNFAREAVNQIELKRERERFRGLKKKKKKMIKAVIVMNTQGKPRLTKFYDFQPPEKQQELIRTLYSVLCSRPENVSNFVNFESIFGPDSRLVYKHYATLTLYFVFVYDNAENALSRALFHLLHFYLCYKSITFCSYSLLTSSSLCPYMTLQLL